MIWLTYNVKNGITVIYMVQKWYQHVSCRDETTMKNRYHSDLDGGNVVPTCFPGMLFLTGVKDNDTSYLSS
eukprot:15351062-Ditylum_brightwellii.AAC.1